MTGHKSFQPDCCQKTRTVGAPCPLGRKCPCDEPTKPATEAEVVEVMIGAWGSCGDLPCDTHASQVMEAALTAARALGCLMPADAAALREEGAACLESARRATLHAHGMEAERDALAADNRRLLDSVTAEAAAHDALAARLPRVEEALQGVTSARDRRDKLKREVQEWLDAEGRAGRLRQAGHAPAWVEYEKAEDELPKVVAALTPPPSKVRT